MLDTTVLSISLGENELDDPFTQVPLSFLHSRQDMRSHQSSRNFGYKAKEYNFRLKLFTAAGLPLPSLQDTTSQLIWQAAERIARKNTSPLNQQTLQDLQVVINMRKATLRYFESQNESDIGHFFWIEFMERVYKALNAKFESLISVRYNSTSGNAQLAIGADTCASDRSRDERDES